MPAAQPPPELDPFRLDRFRPAIHEVETQNYNQLTADFRALRRLEQSAFLTVKYGLIDAERELDRISRMEPDWDSYGAASPSIDAVRASREILKELAGALILPSTIVPSAQGGVSIYFVSGDRTAYIETYDQGTQALVMYDQVGETEVLELGIDIPRSEAGSRILEYLG
jgi:hypothetical protein